MWEKMGVSSLFATKTRSKRGSGQEKEEPTLELPWQKELSSLNRCQLSLLPKSCTCTIIVHVLFAACHLHTPTPPCWGQFMFMHPSARAFVIFVLLRTFLHTNSSLLSLICILLMYGLLISSSREWIFCIQTFFNMSSMRMRRLSYQYQYQQLNYILILHIIGLT